VRREEQLRTLLDEMAEQSKADITVEQTVAGYAVEINCENDERDLFSGYVNGCEHIVDGTQDELVDTLFVVLTPEL